MKAVIKITAEEHHIDDSNVTDIFTVSISDDSYDATTFDDFIDALEEAETWSDECGADIDIRSVYGFE